MRGLRGLTSPAGRTDRPGLDRRPGAVRAGVAPGGARGSVADRPHVPISSHSRHAAAHTITAPIDFRGLVAADPPRASPPLRDLRAELAARPVALRSLWGVVNKKKWRHEAAPGSLTIVLRRADEIIVREASPGAPPPGLTVRSRPEITTQPEELTMRMVRLAIAIGHHVPVRVFPRRGPPICSPADRPIGEAIDHYLDQALPRNGRNRRPPRTTPPSSAASCSTWPGEFRRRLKRKPTSSRPTPDKNFGSSIAL